MSLSAANSSNESLETIKNPPPAPEDLCHCSHTRKTCPYPSSKPVPCRKILSTAQGNILTPLSSSRCLCLGRRNIKSCRFCRTPCRFASSHWPPSLRPRAVVVAPQSPPDPAALPPAAGSPAARLQWRRDHAQKSANVVKTAPKIIVMRFCS